MKWNDQTVAKCIQRILVTDDNHEFQKSLLTILSQEGYDVTGAADGEEALKAFEAGNFDLVLLDIMMPKKEGFETMEDMLEIRPDARIIVMTGGNRWVSNFYLESARDRGAYAILAKPFPMQDLFQLLDELEKESPPTN